MSREPSIRRMERARGEASSGTPLCALLAMILTMVALEHGGIVWAWAALFWLAALYYAFAWWLFWSGCRDYDRRRARAPRSGEDRT